MKKAQRPSKERLAALWLRARWLENVHRYCADLTVGFMESIERLPRKDPTPCIPPKVCYRTWEQIRDELEEIEKISAKFRVELNRAMDEARTERGMKGIAFRPSLAVPFRSGGKRKRS